MTQPRRLEVAASQSWKCADCKMLLTSSFEIDHIEPWSESFDDSRENLRCLCCPCHAKKTANELSVFPAGAWPPHHGRAALPRPGQARPGLLSHSLRLLPAGGGHRMTCRAGLRGFLRGLTLILRGGTSFGESAALVVYYYNPKSALFCLPVAILPATADIRQAT